MMNQKQLEIHSCVCVCRKKERMNKKRERERRTTNIEMGVVEREIPPSTSGVNVEIQTSTNLPQRILDLSVSVAAWGRKGGVGRGGGGGGGLLKNNISLYI